MASETMVQSWTKLRICSLLQVIYHKQQYSKPRIHDSILIANISVSVSYGMESSDRKFIALAYAADLEFQELYVPDLDHVAAELASPTLLLLH